jgi:hypothetical protein
MKYNINEHIHLYAVWTAARAVQRGFVKTEKIKIAIESSDLRRFAERPVVASPRAYQLLHRKWATQLLLSFKAQKVEVRKLTYGRMAKIIAVYLKTAVIIPSKGKTSVCKIIHPPIDAILLKRISKEPNCERFKFHRWTSLNETAYWELCKDIEQSFGYFDWRLEKYWSPLQ